jgi:GntR family transcriptional regulator, transcriptional repressor for pyruvate dehydrogenase complex
MSHGARSALFAPLDQTGRAEAVARRLTDAITLGMLADAEQLPSETELAGRFGVSTVTVREALVQLRQRGLVETRRGRGGGSFVRAPSGPDQRPWRHRLRGLSLAELRDVGDHYAAVAGAAARLAAERAGAEEVARLRLATEDARGPGSPSAAERHFHLEVAAAAQSPRLTRQELELQSGPGGLLWLPPVPAEDPGHPHREITDAIERGAGERARALTEEHILDAVQRLVELHLDSLDVDGG